MLVNCSLRKKDLWASSHGWKQCGVWMGKWKVIQAEERASVKALGKKEQGAPWYLEKAKVARAKKTSTRIQ